MFPAITLFGKTIGLYPISALMGVFAAGIFACKAAKKRGIDDNDMIVFLLICALGGLFGSHILYGITNIEYIPKIIPSIDSFRKFFDAAVFFFGGSVFYGGLIGGAAAGYFYSRRKKLNMREYSDIIAPAIPLLHAFGRIGCFLGGCCYGVPSALGFTYSHALIEAANGVSRFPIQLVESLFNFLLFFALFSLQKRKELKGKLFMLYILLYSTARFVFEFWRGDEIRGFLLGFSTSQIISIVLFLSAGILFLMSVRKKKLQHQ